VLLLLLLLLVVVVVVVAAVVVVSLKCTYSSWNTTNIFIIKSKVTKKNEIFTENDLFSMI